MTVIKVLIVDDEEHTRLGYAEILKMDEEFEFQVDTAENAFVGTDLIKENEYDVIVTDLKMPEMDGITFIDKIRSINMNQNVIVITAFGSFKSYKEASKLGAIQFLNKPLRGAELKKTILEVTGN